MTTSANGTAITCELDQSIWSVVTSLGIRMQSITYAKALRITTAAHLASGDHGIAIITDEAANRYTKKEKIPVANDEEIK